MASPSTSKSNAESADGKSVLPRIISFGFSDTLESENPKLFLCTDWHYHWLQWLVMILRNIEYNVWLGHDSTTLCDSTRLDSRPLWLVTRLDSSTDLSDSWLDSDSTLMTRDSTRDSSQVTRQQLCTLLLPLSLLLCSLLLPNCKGSHSVRFIYLGSKVLLFLSLIEHRRVGIVKRVGGVKITNETKR